MCPSPFFVGNSSWTTISIPTFASWPFKSFTSEKLPLTKTATASSCLWKGGNKPQCIGGNSKISHPLSWVSMPISCSDIYLKLAPILNPWMWEYVVKAKNLFTRTKRRSFERLNLIHDTCSENPFDKISYLCSPRMNLDYLDILSRDESSFEYSRPLSRSHLQWWRVLCTDTHNLSGKRGKPIEFYQLLRSIRS